MAEGRASGGLRETEGRGGNGQEETEGGAFLLHLLLPEGKQMWSLTLAPGPLSPLPQGSSPPGVSPGPAPKAQLGAPPETQPPTREEGGSHCNHKPCSEIRRCPPPDRGCGLSTSVCAAVGSLLVLYTLWVGNECVTTCIHRVASCRSFSLP